MSLVRLHGLCLAGWSVAEDAAAGRCWARESTATESGIKDSAVASAPIKFLSSPREAPTTLFCPSEGGLQSLGTAAAPSRHGLGERLKMIGKIHSWSIRERRLRDSTARWSDHSRHWPCNTYQQEQIQVRRVSTAVHVSGCQ
ncbi:hypothetical protein GRJ2_001947100 [Grus japonensis]|uniref:Secreted protein n=1 Tax=Grus japonensis TaxID=30415 RepID=A0ABC9XAV2_GRUJA